MKCPQNSETIPEDLRMIRAVLIKTKETVMTPVILDFCCDFLGYPVLK